MNKCFHCELDHEGPCKPIHLVTRIGILAKNNKIQGKEIHILSGMNATLEQTIVDLKLKLAGKSSLTPRPSGDKPVGPKMPVPRDAMSLATAICNYSGVDIDDIFRDSRFSSVGATALTTKKILIWEMSKDRGVNEVAEFFGAHYSTISHHIKKARDDQYVVNTAKRFFKFDEEKHQREAQKQASEAQSLNGTVTPS